MLPGINPYLIGLLVKGELDEILKGKVPQGFEVKEKTDKKFIFKQIGEAELVDGVKVKSFSAVVVHKETEIVFCNE